MCKERKIPEILICSPCDAVTEEDAEKEYELRKHYKRVFRRGESKTDALHGGESSGSSGCCKKLLNF